MLDSVTTSTWGAARWKIAYILVIGLQSLNSLFLKVFMVREF